MSRFRAVLTQMFTSARATASTDSGSTDDRSVYRARRTSRVLPGEVRRKQFSPTKLGRRGLDPDEVHHFLNRVAEELNALYRDLATSEEQASRIRNALREWQAQQAERPGDEHTRPRHRQPERRAGQQASRPHPNTRFTVA